jgi:4a-hydroxytetrahydrobiopterin dehydratase
MTLALGPAKANMAGRRIVVGFSRNVSGGCIGSRRAFRSTMVNSMPKATDIRVSDGEPYSSAIIEQATTLIEKRGWILCADGKGLERGFRFKTFAKTWVSVLNNRRSIASEGAL